LGTKRTKEADSGHSFRERSTENRLRIPGVKKGKEKLRRAPLRNKSLGSGSGDRPYRGLDVPKEKTPNGSLERVSSYRDQEKKKGP